MEVVVNENIEKSQEKFDWDQSNDFSSGYSKKERNDLEKLYTDSLSSVDEKAKSFHDGFISKTLCCQGSEGKRKASAMEAGSGLVFS